MVDRLMLFIDGSNLFMGTKRVDPAIRIDYLKLRAKLCGDRKIIRAYYYGSFDASNVEMTRKQQHFHEKLQQSGFEVVVTPLRERDGKRVEKGADVSLAIDMVSHGLRNTYDVAIIVSGDDDFLKAVDEVKRAGKRVEVAYYAASVGRRLRNAGDLFVDLTPLLSDIRQA